MLTRSPFIEVQLRLVLAHASGAKAKRAIHQASINQSDLPFVYGYRERTTG